MITTRASDNAAEQQGIVRNLRTLSRSISKQSSMVLNSLYHTYKTNEVSLSLAKLLITTVISLTLDNWWRFGSAGSHSGVVDSCSNPDHTICSSFCNDTYIVDVPIAHDDYTLDDDVFARPRIHRGSNPFSESYCIAFFRKDCAYEYWLTFRLVPICMHAVAFLMQFAVWWYYKTFTPQQEQFNTIISYRFPEVPGAEEVALSGDSMQDFVSMLRQLMKRPSDSIFSFLQVATVLYAWGELWFPPIFCNDIRPLSLYYFPIMITLIDFTHFNLFVARRLVATKKYHHATLALLHVEMFFVYITVSLLLSGVFVAGVVSDLCGRVWWQCMRIAYSLGGANIFSISWPEKAPHERSTAGTGTKTKAGETEMVTNPMSEKEATTDVTTVPVVAGAPSNSDGFWDGSL